MKSGLTKIVTKSTQNITFLIDVQGVNLYKTLNNAPAALPHTLPQGSRGSFFPRIHIYTRDEFSKGLQPLFVFYR